MHFSIFGLNLAALFSNVTLKIKFVMPMYRFMRIGKNQLVQSEDNVHLSILP